MEKIFTYLSYELFLILLANTNGQTCSYQFSQKVNTELIINCTYSETNQSFIVRMGIITKLVNNNKFKILIDRKDHSDLTDPDPQFNFSPNK